jgi:geranylgeranyl reductase family protein
MAAERFDAVVVGAGPAGSVAALVLARNGARVALVDKATFPRDKACGDLVGPRGVQVLDDLGLEIPGALRVGDMLVVGPHHQVRLPCRPGRTYPGYALAVPRERFDAQLRDAAVAAGAEPLVGRAAAPLVGSAGVEGCTLADGAELRADTVIGADGALSAVGSWADLVDPARVLWGFALRAYIDEPVALPQIVVWEPTPRRAFPGYGWVFPGPDGAANVGLGCGTLADRSAGGLPARRWDQFSADLVHRGVLTRAPRRSDGSLGGWLKLGMVGTQPARGRVLLVGDAAGLVNPLQGEGIAQAMESAHIAAYAVLAGPDQAAARYRAELTARHSRFQASTAALHAALLPHPAAVSAVARTLTAPPIGWLLAGGWALYWNDLLEGATPGSPRSVAALADRVARGLTGGGATRRWFREALESPAPDLSFDAHAARSR